jgi:hypothetical protein
MARLGGSLALLLVGSRLAAVLASRSAAFKIADCAAKIERYFDAAGADA